MFGIALSLVSALSWGSGDFLGGLLTRRWSSLAVVAWSQVVGGGLILSVTLALRVPFAWSAFGWGMLAGIFGLVGLLALYRGLALGPMALVSPISACGAVVPICAAFVLGRAPAPVALVGIVLAFLGIVLASLPTEKPATGARFSWRGLLMQRGNGYAVVAAGGFGFFFLFLAQGAAHQHFATLWAIVGARAASLAIIFGGAALTRRPLPLPKDRLALLCLTGICDTGANTLYAFATTQGNLGIVSVIGSLYPITTVLLAFIILHERLNVRQACGVAVALLGVAGMALG
jgi:drug/metabolite transporter (DMT)-like permease